MITKFEATLDAWAIGLRFTSELLARVEAVPLPSDAVDGSCALKAVLERVRIVLESRTHLEMKPAPHEQEPLEMSDRLIAERVSLRDSERLLRCAGDVAGADLCAAIQPPPDSVAVADAASLPQWRDLFICILQRCIPA